MSLAPGMFLRDILESVELIERYKSGLDKEGFFQNVQLQDSVLRRLEIIGEAVKNLPTEFRGRHPQVPWKEFAGLRDVLIHRYGDVDLDLTWKTLEEDLPNLKQQVTAILSLESAG